MFPVALGLREWMAVAFAALTGPAGARRTTSSAASVHGMLGRFARHLATLPSPPSEPGELRAVHLTSFQFTATAGTRNFNREVPMLRSVVRCALQDLHPEFLARIMQIRRPRTSTPIASYTNAEFDRITAAARKQVRAAAARIRSGRELLTRWRAGQIDGVSDRDGWEHGMLLDHIDRHGDAPRPGIRESKAAKHWTLRRLMSELHLTSSDNTAAAVLLICVTGQNLGTVASATARHHRPDAHTGVAPVAVVDLLKPRRGQRHAHMPTALPGPAGTAMATTPGRRDDLYTPFGVYTTLVELAGPARAQLGTDRLLAYYDAHGGRTKGFRDGLVKSGFRPWGVAAGLVSEPLDESVPETLVVSAQRLRVSWLERHQRPVAHTERTLATEYLARNRGNLAEYQEVVARVQHEQVAAAHAVLGMRVLTAQDVELARQAPDVAAARHELEPTTLQELLAGRLDTVLGGCADHLHGPHSQPGQPCQASFLLCLSCPCARATPQHLPMLAAVHDALLDRRHDMTPLRWAERFAAPVGQLADVLEQFPAAAVTAARATATDAQRDLVRRFLTKGLDLT
ncbi:hypothetical protein AB0C24_13575 [Amycolatopsis japonica]|uniref:hypothetical protein n=1 Tax=Amycolatopsis japonica TaxID=208439 RepID=UPI0033CC7F34